MAALTGANLCLCGSHAGSSIGQDGPSQMGLEDIAMMRAVCDSTVLYPSDPNQTAQLVEQMAQTKGISYLRTTRAKLPTIYEAGESLPDRRQQGRPRIGLGTRSPSSPPGSRFHEALKAHDELKNSRDRCPRDRPLLDQADRHRDFARRRAKATGKFVVVEDHWPEGGLGDAVLGAFTGVGVTFPQVVKLAVSGMPGSAKPEELLSEAGIDAQHIVKAVRSLL